MKGLRNKLATSGHDRRRSRAKKGRTTIKTPAAAASELTKHIKILGHGASPDGERFLKLRIRSAQGNVRPLIRLDDLTEGSLAGLNRYGAHLISPVLKMSSSTGSRPREPGRAPLSLPLSSVTMMEPSCCLPGWWVSL